jgi:hypothetical protein
MAVVRPVDPPYVEVRGQGLDLTEEVDRLEPALAQLVRQRVRGRGQLDSCRDQLTQQPRDQHRVARVVQLELVDTDQPVRRQGLDGGTQAESTDQVGELDERAVHLRPGRLVPERGEEVGLADAESAVEVDALLARGRGVAAEPVPERRGLPGLGEVRGAGGQGLERFGLGGLVGVGAVGAEAGVGEAQRRDALRQQTVGAHLRPLLAQPDHHGPTLSEGNLRKLSCDLDRFLTFS